MHYWAVWHGSKPVSDYLTKKFRFCSEFGFESFPTVKTIESFCEKEDMNIFSEVMENHQKCCIGNVKILTYIADTYLYPTSFSSIVYASQLNQAEAIRAGVEHFRRIRGCCMGAIYWQLNDCWPVASWSSIDCFGRYKALHYAARKFFAPLIMSICHEENEITLNIANEKREASSGKIKYGIYDNDFNIISEASVSYNVSPLSSTNIKTLDISDFAGKKNIFFAADLYDNNNNFIMRQTHLYVKPKYYNWEKPEFTVRIAENNGEFILSISSNAFGKMLKLIFLVFDMVLSDNFFDITSEEPVVITAKPCGSVDSLTAEKIKEAISFKSVYDIR